MSSHIFHVCGISHLCVPSLMTLNFKCVCESFISVCACIRFDFAVYFWMCFECTSTEKLLPTHSAQIQAHLQMDAVNRLLKFSVEWIHFITLLTLDGFCRGFSWCFIMVHADVLLQAMSALKVFPIQATRYILCITFYNWYSLTYFMHTQVVITVWMFWWWNTSGTSDISMAKAVDPAEHTYGHQSCSAAETGCHTDCNQPYRFHFFYHKWKSWHLLCLW